MRVGIWVPLVYVLVPGFASAQAAIDYAVLGATTAQENLLRTLIQKMRPDVLPARAIFVPHWKYVADARIFRVHVPTGYTSYMFTHLPTRTVFIDNDRIQGEQFLGYWIAHELGHLAANSISEEDAEKAASALRKRLKAAKSPALTN